MIRLHGGIGFQSQAARAMVYYHWAASQGKMPAAFIVASRDLPQGRWGNSMGRVRRVEDIVTQDLIAHPKSTFRVESES
ncbi:uncharacterized protein N7483_002689 [Penicillium malachiteum]|uniref:uncharacterized protein n=1 Tax=Penicillium malachiteum TaxID=1324776 RepID=UPI0025469245|nr:uncharacterized protein N7483_002689 [Penicillium malachiteum]KAJ5737564.1 hypothetical protein N7483_002689 [Penicillium malachiteum]